MLNPVALALALAACAAAAPAPPRAESAADNDNLMLQAETAIAQGQAEDAHQALLSVAPERLDPNQTLRYQLLQAEVLLAQDKPVEALQLLPSARQQGRDPKLAVRLEGDRASALFRMGDAVGGTQAMLQRERLLADTTQRAQNRDQLWAGLRNTDLDTASGPRLAQADKVVRGWVELAVISRSVWLDPHDLDARVAQWKADYPGHAATERIPTLTQVAAAPPHSRLSQVALLLPMSGSIAVAAEAVRDGFFSAFYENADPAAPRPDVHVYDTGLTPDTLKKAYRDALDDGAQFIIGPLRREDVTAFANDGRPPVPVLALNYLDPGQTPPFNFFQWGLAPEDEARQAAERAIADRQYRAVTMVPEGEWGERVLRAFRDRLTQLGGAVVDSRTYSVAERDYSEPIQELMALNASEERHRMLTVVLGTKTEFQPRRRDDVDLVFIAARPEQARLLGPQFHFHRSGELPIYATSAIYDGETASADLNGLRFCDMPWMLSQDGDVAALRTRLQTVFDNRPKEQTRLLALGHDAYTLVRLIDGGQLKPGSFFPAASGTLSIREDGVIARGLTCAEIRNGAARPLEAPSLSAR